MTVTRAARLTGAALSVALALTAAVWIVRDLAATGSPAELAWLWAGDHRFLLQSRTATSGLDPLLLLVHLATAVAALRSPLAASALAASGAVTLALRIPGLWATSAGTAALVTTLVDLALAAALLVTAAVGRRPADSTYEPLPARPRPGPAVAAGVLLLAAGLAWTAWEVHWALEFPAEVTVDRYTGGRSLLAPLLAPPPGWLSAVLVLLLLTAAGSAFARPPYSRPLGLVAGALLWGGGLMGVAVAVRYELFARFPDLSGVQQLTFLTSLFEMLAGAAVLAVLAAPGERRVAPAPPGTPALAPAPPSPRPPGW
ncbi:hypothetical protein [Streptomyces vilmorinianum]|uniref:hypothetical protein n=1 Tax=Streptomyces vilmorinianum TaxID=3051092 RepID=UPI0020C776FB|nr:hypothetical protein [Streptomyces vilmorinianum]